MTKGRLEAFTDGVIAIIITVMVLEIKVPHGASLADLAPLTGTFVSYVLSFLYVGIYWNNHHHTLHASRSIDGAVQWANLHLIFWLSLLPFTTGWVGENHFARIPMFFYGLNLLLAALAYTIFTRCLVRHHGRDSALAQAFGRDWKGKLSLALYVLGMALTFLNPWAGFACYIAVALVWFIPDPRMRQAFEMARQPGPEAG
ncbi:MAG: DUF1211 domain-containing protein [Proteobacteria bacterium]|nr:DUF1211 domain-containing protein [Pseudomonadota bacterium]